jgi:pilus assembly protein Flp/PilA
MIMGFRKACARCRFGFYARNERGATAVEYGLMVSLIAVVIIVAVTAFGTALKVALFGMINASLPF